MKRIATLLFLVALVPARVLRSRTARRSPVLAPTAAGFAVVSLDGTTLDYTLFVQNIGTPTLAQIHRRRSAA